MAWPRGISYIIGTEFAERFSYYGFRAILVVYMVSYLRIHEDHATMANHAYNVSAYMMAIVGAVLADSYWGRYTTILRMSLIYLAGSAIIAGTSIPGATGNPPHWWGLALGLAVIAVGSGGIKPCVSAFAGDQFHNHTPDVLSRFYAAFYYVVNVAAISTMIATPLIHEFAHCFGERTCFPAAFGASTAIMAMAIILFFVGSRLYHKEPTSPTVIRNIRGALCIRRTAYGQVGERPLAPASRTGAVAARYGEEFARELQAAKRLLVLFIPMPLFWACFDQQGTRWTLQALQMDGHGLIRATQVQALNALLILILVPIFEYLVYPAFACCGFPLSSLQRMGYGMVFVAAAFATAAALQLRIDQTCCASLSSEELVRLPGIHEGIRGCTSSQCVSIGWQVPQYVLLTCGEVLFSITNNKFVYTQAPTSMKSLIQAASLMTIAAGNVVVIAIVESNVIKRQAHEFIVFAALVLGGALVFAVLGRNYRGADAGPGTIELTEISDDAAPLVWEVDGGYSTSSEA